MAKRVLSMDLETFSDVDLPNCGVHRYVEGDFHILLFAYAFDDEETQCVDLYGFSENIVLPAVTAPSRKPMKS